MNGDFFAGVFARHEEVFRTTHNLFPEIEKAGDVLRDAVRDNKVMFTCGNGDRRLMLSILRQNSHASIKLIGNRWPQSRLMGIHLI